jgi:radical SAM-linked protein
MAYSSGFNPHPRISYAGAAPTGSASEAEYLEIGLAEVVAAEDVRRDLAEALPGGLDILEVVEAEGGSLADRLEASHWQIDLAEPLVLVAPAVARFLGQESVRVERMTKKGLREFDCRAAVISLGVADGDRGARLELVLRHAVPAVRPDDVLSGLAVAGGLELGEAPLLTRLAQGPLDETTGSVGDPLHVSS